MINRLCIIGVGLIGGSLARALKAAGACREIVGSGRNKDNLYRAVELDVIDRYELDPARAVKGADVVVLGVPVGAVETVAAAIGPYLEPDAVLTDVGSTKRSVVDAVERGCGKIPAGFVPGHPIAGTEQSGVEASFSELFRERRVILTPLKGSRPEATAKVRAMWETAGAEVVEMDVFHHDEVLAATSHLPHVLAFTLVDTLSRMDEHPEIFDFAAGGFRDFTRIASSDPTMWRDICLSNSEAILAVLDRYSEELDTLAAAIRAGEGEAVLESFQRAKAARDKFCG